MLQVAKLTDWMDDAGQCWLTLLLSTVFFEKEQLVRDSFEIKGLGYIEWLEARLPSRVDVGQASKRAGGRSGRRLSE